MKQKPWQIVCLGEPQWDSATRSFVYGWVTFGTYSTKARAEKILAEIKIAPILKDRQPKIIGPNARDSITDSCSKENPMSKKKASAKIAAAQVEPKKKVTSKKAKEPSESSLAAEVLLEDVKASLPDGKNPDATMNELRALLARAAQLVEIVDGKKNPSGYLMQTIEARINDPEDPTNKKVEKGYQTHRLDDDELRVGPDLIKRAAKALAKTPQNLAVWAVTIDGVQLAPRKVYAKAFELDGFEEIDWEYNTHRALSWLEHHGFPVEKIG
jgi:hypothetical protein